MFPQRERGGGEAPAGRAGGRGSRRSPPAEARGARPLGEGVPGSGRAARPSPNEVPTEFLEAKTRRKEKGRWAEGKRVRAWPHGTGQAGGASEPTACNKGQWPRREGGGWGSVCGLWARPPASDPGRAAPHLSARTCVQRPPCTRRRPALCAREIVHFTGRFGCCREIMCL